MTRRQVIPLIDQFGEIRYNGTLYPSCIHGFIRDVSLSHIRIERLEGNDIEIPIASIKQFTPKKAPALVEL